MPAAADDDHVIGRLRVGLAPGRLPVPVSGQRIPDERKGRIFPHDCLIRFGSTAQHYSQPCMAKARISPSPFASADLPHCVLARRLARPYRRLYHCHTPRTRPPNSTSCIEIMPIVLNRYVIALFLLVCSAVLPLQAAAQDVGKRRPASIDEQRDDHHSARQEADDLREAGSRAMPRMTPGSSRSAWSSRNCARELLSSAVRIPPAAVGDKCAARAARTAAGRRPAARARHRHARATER